MSTPTIHAPGITRRASGLTPAHFELVKLLAQRAVEDYLAEVEATDAPSDDRDEVRR